MGRSIAIAVPLPAGLDVGAALRDDPGRWLPNARAQGPRLWRFRVEALGMARPVLCEVSNPVVTRSGVTRRLSWEPETREADIVAGERFLPGFNGEVRIVGAPATPSVVLTGTVEPPLGRLGEALDQVALGGLADRSLDSLLQQVAERLVGLASDAAGGRPPGGSGRGASAGGAVQASVTDVAPTTTVVSPPG